MNYKGFEIIINKKEVNHKFNIKRVYSIKTDLWFNCIEFLNLKSLYEFINKEIKEGLK